MEIKFQHSVFYLLPDFEKAGKLPAFLETQSPLLYFAQQRRGLRS